MIKVLVIKTQKEDRINNVTIKGHADYAENGSDIVCSAVSALTLGTINSVESLLKIDLKPEQNLKSGGFLSWNVPLIENKVTDSQLQLLMKSLIESLLMIEQEYKRNLKVKIETS